MCPSSSAWLMSPSCLQRVGLHLRWSLLGALWACFGYGVSSTPSSLPGWAGSGSCMCGGACFSSLPPPSSSSVGLICAMCLDNDGLVSPWWCPGLAAALAPVLLHGYGDVECYSSSVVCECAIVVEPLCRVECGFLRHLLPLYIGMCMCYAVWPSGVAAIYCAITVFTLVCVVACSSSTSALALCVLLVWRPA